MSKRRLFHRSVAHPVSSRNVAALPKIAAFVQLGSPGVVSPWVRHNLGLPSRPLHRLRYDGGFLRLGGQLGVLLRVSLVLLHNLLGQPREPVMG